VIILDFPSISLKGDLMKASELILNDKKHLDNNPKPVTKQNIITLLKTINSGNVLNEDIKFDF
jgi:succinate semialdehyde reductase